MIALFVPKKKLKEGLTCIKKVARLNFAAVIIEIYKKKEFANIYGYNLNNFKYRNNSYTVYHLPLFRF